MITLLLGLALSGCASSGTATPEPPSTAVPDISLPAGPLRDLVPATADLPPGMVPILSGSGSRDADAVAAYSADPVTAKVLLGQHGFTGAYVGQYADPADGRVLSVVVTRFATTAGAAADLAGDLTGSGGTRVATPTLGEQSEVRRQPLPAASPASTSTGELVTVRFRQGDTTWLVAYGARPTADPEVATEVAQRLLTKAAAAA